MNRLSTLTQSMVGVDQGASFKISGSTYQRPGETQSYAQVLHPDGSVFADVYGRTIEEARSRAELLKTGLDDARRRGFNG